MKYGAKISRSDFITGKKSQKNHKKQRQIEHILLILAIPYLRGAKLQVKRYKKAALTLREDSINGVHACLHEASCLFEDLATVSKYAQQCNKRHDLHKLLIDIRNHIRHDVREQFDNENDLQKGRAIRLKIKPHLQMDIGFDKASIRIGGTIIKLMEIEEYLAWAVQVINSSIEKAGKRGMIKA